MPVYTYFNLYDIPEYIEYMKCWYKNNELHHDCDLPAVEYVYIYENKCWYKNGKYHRDGDLPAIEYDNSEKYWYKNGFYHRNNNQTEIEYEDGDKEWYKNNECYFPLICLITITINKIMEIKIGKIGDKWWYESTL